MGPDARTRELQAKSTAVIMQAHIEPKDDMRRERARATFNVQQLKETLAGGKEKLDKRAQFIEILQKTSWGDKSRRHFLTREEEYVGGLKAALGIWSEMKARGLSLDDGAVMRYLVDFPGGLELHIGMFIPTIMGQGTPEQQAYWMPRCMQLSVIGTYAQTELGHGTFVRGLETTATYDAATQEFIVHSPTLTATKWWPGGLGKTSTHAVVMARLFDGRGVDRGPHAFIVQLRDMASHLPLPGVTVGDIGPKFGFGGVDNGYLSFDHVRIPRVNMLMRYSQVAEDGTYTPPPPANAKASYATMVFVRSDIVKNAGAVLARAATIGVRYAAVRRQTAPAPGQPETQVLDYQNTAHTLLPLVAGAYALTFMGESMMRLYRGFERDRERGEFGGLPELHALSSGLKALCTQIAADGIEACRRTCGGHGYSRLSGLPSLYASYVQNVTWEGDNNVLYLQTARYLVKAFTAAVGGKGGAGGKGGGSAAYLASAVAELGARCAVQGPACWGSHEVQGAALRHVAVRLARNAVGALRAETNAQGGPKAERGELDIGGSAWNATTVPLIRLARAHCFVVLHDNMLAAIKGLAAGGKAPKEAVGVLGQLASLLALHELEERAGELQEDGYATGAQVGALRAAHRGLLRGLRPNAVALVDALGVEDYVLHSCLGREDGDVYAALLAAVADNPLNATQEGPAWHGLLQPLLAHSKL